MYLGSQEVEKINDDNSVLLKNGNVIEGINEKLITDEPLTGSDLQMKFSQVVATEIVDVLHKNNVRLVDIQLIMNLVNDVIAGKNDEAVVEKFGKDKLDSLSSVFGSDEKIASISIRQIRIKDIF